MADRDGKLFPASIEILEKDDCPASKEASIRAAKRGIAGALNCAIEMFFGDKIVISISEWSTESEILDGGWRRTRGRCDIYVERVIN